jgi:predicted Zn-dependent protease
MLDKIISELKSRKDLAGWTVRHISSNGAQVYLVPTGIEAEREVRDEKYRIEVLRHTKSSDGSPTMGSGPATLLPGGDISAAIEEAALVAGLVTNPPHSMPKPAPLPQVSLVDASIKADASKVSVDTMKLLQQNAKFDDVRLTSAECFADTETVHLVNSEGIDAHQEGTHFDIEYVLQSRRGEANSEMFTSANRRRVSDLNLVETIAKRAQYTRDLLEPSPAPNWDGAVVVRTGTLANFLSGDNLVPGVLRTLSDGGSKYAKVSPWEIGQSIFRSEVKGDPFSFWGNRTAAYGNQSDLFDGEGIPAQRAEVVKDNVLKTFVCTQKYSDYLKIPATGDLGNIEVPAGQTSAQELLSEPYVEVVMFSWFNPEPISGDFASEIRLGYLVENGKAKPFKGGQLIGNVLEGLANVRWSRETGFYGNYLGPHTARFSGFKVAAG